ncbi:unnamed protein product [Linum tenue]|uniref:Transposase MuDR plant domain-containing protein n=1 Tax=Linum tenue TaxID=586396 RepID=A0AAV0NG24_9ROSI|nr:unnamed protein product [Linum tenue]
MVYIVGEDVCYFGGEVKYLDWIDPDCLSLFELDGYLVDFDHFESVRMLEEYRTTCGWSYYWRLPGERLKEGLRELTSDKDIVYMAAKVIQDTKFVEVYLINKEEFHKAAQEADKEENVREGDRVILHSPFEQEHDLEHGLDDCNLENNDGEAGREGSTEIMHSTVEQQHVMETGLDDRDLQGNDEEADKEDDRVDSDIELASGENFEVGEDDLEGQDNDGKAGNHKIFIDDAFEGSFEDDQYDSDYLGSVHSDDDEEEQRVPTRPRYPEFNPEKDMSDPQFCLHQVFRDFDTFKDAIKNYSINSKQPLKFKHSDKSRVQVVCQQGCPWNIWVGPTDDGKAVQIRTCRLQHEGCVLVFKNRFGDVNFIARRYLQRFQADMEWKTESIIQTVAEDYNWTISRWKAWRIKRTAKELLRGNAKEQYRKLQDYCAQVRRTSPGSTCYVETSENSNIFKRMYCCLEPCKRGIASCRKIVMLDGCFLKTEYGGQLLSAVGLDGNGGSFPISYAAVTVENGENWTWFLKQLCVDLNIFEDLGSWMFMSDKQKVCVTFFEFDYAKNKVSFLKPVCNLLIILVLYLDFWMQGLLNALESIVPYAEHRCCVRHLVANLYRAQGSNKTTRDLLWNAARASYDAEFKRCMNELKNYDDKAQQLDSAS